MKKLCLILATTLLCGGCATLDTTFNVLKVVTFPVGVLGTIAGNPVDTFYTVQQVQQWVKSSNRSAKSDSTTEPENTGSDAQEHVDSNYNQDSNPRAGTDDSGNSTSTSSSEKQSENAEIKN